MKHALVSGKQFDPLKLLSICRRDAVLRRDLTQFWVVAYSDITPFSVKSRCGAVV
jgi:hypothetical protein